MRVQALVLPRTDSAAFLKACAEAEVLQELEIVPEACAAMLCTAKAGLQQRQKRPIMAADVSSLSSAQKLARRLLEVEMGLLRSWQAAAAEMLQGGPGRVALTWKIGWRDELLCCEAQRCLKVLHESHAGLPWGCGPAWGSTQLCCAA